MITEERPAQAPPTRRDCARAADLRDKAAEQSRLLALSDPEHGCADAVCATGEAAACGVASTAYVMQASGAEKTSRHDGGEASVGAATSPSSNGAVLDLSSSKSGSQAVRGNRAQTENNSITDELDRVQLGFVHASMSAELYRCLLYSSCRYTRWRCHVRALCVSTIARSACILICSGLTKPHWDLLVRYLSVHVLAPRFLHVSKNARLHKSVHLTVHTIHACTSACCSPGPTSSIASSSAEKPCPIANKRAIPDTSTRS